jgi:PAS domain-containing protein
MKKQITDSPEAAILRQKAEKLLKIKQAKTGIPSSEADTLKLIHELQVYQIELELINEELLLANIRIENLAIEKYKELYDFAPTGYLSLSKTGEITEINFAAANMLGKDRLHLMNNSFALFLSENTRPVFIAFLNNVFTSKVKHSCEVIIAKEGSLPLHVYIDGIISHNNEFCILTLVDFTKTKRNPPVNYI